MKISHTSRLLSASFLVLNIYHEALGMEVMEVEDTLQFRAKSNDIRYGLKPSPSEGAKRAREAMRETASIVKEVRKKEVILPTQLVIREA